MARDWSDLFIVPGPGDRGGVSSDSQPAPGAEDDASRDEQGDRDPARPRSAPRGWMRQLRESMARQIYWGVTGRKP